MSHNFKKINSHLCLLLTHNAITTNLKLDKFVNYKLKNSEKY